MFDESNEYNDNKETDKRKIDTGMNIIHYKFTKQGKLKKQNIMSWKCW